MMTKRSSFSHKTRHSLSDITNSRPQQQQQQQELILQETGLEQSEKVNRLMKENLALVKLLGERDETIEQNKYEMRNLREGIHRLQVQNLSLAQTNSQFFAEINLARNKMKALHHEVTCKNALLKTKCYEPQKEENTQPRNLVTTENNKLETTDEESEKPYVPNRRKFIRSKSFRASTAYETDVEKEKSQTKRRQSRRKSAILRSSSQETKENNLFEIKDLQLTIPSEMSQQEEENLQRRRRSSLIALRHDDDDDDCKVSKSPFNRTLRKAVKKIHSYKGGY